MQGGSRGPSPCGGPLWSEPAGVTPSSSGAQPRKEVTPEASVSQSSVLSSGTFVLIFRCQGGRSRDMNTQAEGEAPVVHARSHLQCVGGGSRRRGPLFRSSPASRPPLFLPSSVHGNNSHHDCGHPGHCPFIFTTTLWAQHSHPSLRQRMLSSEAEWVSQSQGDLLAELGF